MDSTLIHYGGAVKTIGDDGKVGGYLVVFGDEHTPDLSAHRDYFTKATDFDIEDGDKRSIFFSHGLDAKMGKRKIGKVAMKVDDVGVWVDGQLNLRDEYEQAIYRMVKAGKLGWSSGAVSHLVERKSVGDAHEITVWPIGESSLTPTPAEPRADALSLKALPSLLGLAPPAEDHTTKALPAGMSYDDLRSLLQDELNEDIGDSDDGPWGGGLWIVDIYDDALVYRDDADLIRIPYTVTAGNDVTWGAPGAVIRTTVYQPATDDDAGEDAGIVTQKDASAPKARADVAALKAMLRDSMTFGDHADIALDAMEGFVTRAQGASELCIKSGRAMSAANRAKLKKVSTGMQAAHGVLGEHITYLNAMLDETQGPVAKKAVDVEVIRFLEFEARRLGVAI
jgi:phage head maturation protease